MNLSSLSLPFRTLCLGALILGLGTGCSSGEPANVPTPGSGGSTGGSGNAASSGHAGTTGSGAFAGSGSAGSSTNGGSIGSAGTGGSVETGGTSGSTGLGGDNGGGAGSGGASARGGVAGTGTSGVAGGSGQGGSGTAGSAGGNSGTSGGAPGTGGRATPSTDSTTFGLNGPSKCASGGFAICEDFEATAEGAIPTGWAKEGSWAAMVSTTDKARGSHSLQIAIGTDNNGRGFLNKTAAQLGPLASKHYGRMFYKVQNLPTKFLHWDFFHGPGPYNGGSNDVRWGFTGTPGAQGTGALTYLFNVQTSNAGEFGINSPGTDKLVADQWTCVEWLLDSTVAGGGEARFWLNGTEVTNMHRTGAQAQIPVFTRYGIGWELFNATDKPSIAYIDEVVFDAERVGCNN